MSAVMRYAQPLALHRRPAANRVELYQAYRWQDDTQESSPMHDRTVFFISDGTGITAESVGHLLSHFPGMTFRQIRMPFIDTAEKVEAAFAEILRVTEEDQARPVAIVTLIKPEWRTRLIETGAFCIDVFGFFVDPLAVEFQRRPAEDLGMSRGVQANSYHKRIDAINYSLSHDDGMTDANLDEAQVILIGVSRCGKTPTCLYLAMQFGIKAANYPLIPEDFARGSLPAVLAKYPEKLFGLTIKPERLHSVRSERKPGSAYAALDNCRKEVRAAEDIMSRAGIAWLDSSTRSIEEIATTILQRTRMTPDETFL